MCQQRWDWQRAGSQPGRLDRIDIVVRAYPLCKTAFLSYGNHNLVAKEHAPNLGRDTIDKTRRCLVLHGEGSLFGIWGCHDEDWLFKFQ